MEGDAEKAPPSILYWVVKPLTGATVGKMKADAQVFSGAVIDGAVGNMTTLTVLLLSQDPEPAVPATVPPQVDVSTYLAAIE